VPEDRHAPEFDFMSHNVTREVYVRAEPMSWKARNEVVYHNANCPKLSQGNVKSNAYRPVAEPPDGSRPCKRCGG
jgi:hypothetical protein